MAKINLRPWREELRAEKQKRFLTSLIGVALISTGLGLGWNSDMTAKIEHQEARNNYLAAAMLSLDEKIKEISELQKQRKELVSRMKVIQDLQGTRPVIVRVFDELVRTLPDGLYYESVKKTGDDIVIQGVAESNSRISGLMRNLDNSEWFTNPNLTAVNAVQKGEPASKFNLVVTQKTAVVEDLSKGDQK